MKPINLSCPACGRRPVTCIQPSIRGAYCQCASCHHMWQQDGLAVTRGEWLGAEKRRVTDRSGASLAPREAQEQAATTCIYCGMEDDSGHVCSVDLLKRRILELQAENAHLRDSALSFGDLAERLNQRMAADTANRNRPTMAPLKSPDGRAEG